MTLRIYNIVVVLICITANAQQCTLDELQPYTELGGDHNDSRVRIKADFSEADYERARFSGSVRLSQGNKHIIAPKLSYDDAKSRADVSAGGIFASDKFVIRGEGGSYDFTNEIVTFENAQYYWQGEQQAAVGAAQQARFNNKTGKDELEKLTWTTCARNDPSWFLSAESLSVDRNKQRAAAKNITFHIADTPVMYLPYFSFPISSQRQSGFLAPAIASSEERGVELYFPYYINIAANQDATLALRTMSKRSVMLEGEYRYLGEKQRADLFGSFLPDDNSKNHSKRWSMQLRHNYQFDDNLRSELLFQQVSDRNYFDDLRSGFERYEEWYLERKFAIYYNNKFGDFSLLAQDYQRITDKVAEEDKPYSKLPQLSYHYRGGDKNFNYYTDLEAVHFSKHNSVTATRLDGVWGVAYRFSKSYGYLEPHLSVRATHYNFSDNLPQRNRLLPTFSLDSKLIFERDLNAFGQNYRQTIEPRLFYLYTPHRNQSDIPIFDSDNVSQSWNWLFGRNRFSGADRIGDANQLTTAVTTRFFDDDDGQEKMRFSLGQIQYFQDRKVNLSPMTNTRTRSVFVGEGLYHIDKHWDLYALGFWDDQARKNRRNVIDLRYHLDDDRFVSLAHRYQQNDYDQLSLAGSWRINPQWRGFFRQDYSLSYGRGFNSLLAIEFDDCCFAWRVVGKRYRDNPQEDKQHNLMYLEFVFKGLGNMGNRSAALLKEEINGFKPLVEEKLF